MPLHHVLFARLHTQTIWCIFCSPSLAGMRTRIAHSKQPERNKYDALDRSAAMTRWDHFLYTYLSLNNPSSDVNGPGQNSLILNQKLSCIFEIQLCFSPRKLVICMLFAG